MNREKCRWICRRNFGGLALLIILGISCHTGKLYSAEGDAESTEAAWRLRLEQQIQEINRQLLETPNNQRLYSLRGDLRFFLGAFDEAVSDYDKLVDLDPALDQSHWRRGIALFYAGEYAQAAAQFERYHSFDNVDRENGIWRYFSQFKAKGKEAARRELLRYEKDDREPFGDVYKLFAGTMEGSAILKKIEAADLEESERNKRMFYAQLYIGLNEAIEGREEAASKHLQAAAENRWARAAGYGPHYMWQVARLHARLLSETDRSDE